MKDRYWPDWNELIGKPKEYDAMNIESGTPSRSRPVSRRQSDDKLRRRKSAGSKSRTEPSSHVGVNQGSTDNEDDSSRLSDASSQSGKVGHVKIVEHMVSGKFDKRNANVKWSSPYWSLETKSVVKKQDLHSLITRLVMKIVPTVEFRLEINSQCNHQAQISVYWYFII